MRYLFRVGREILEYSTYLVSSPIIAYYYSQLIGDAKSPPTLLAATNFNGMAVIGLFSCFPTVSQPHFL